jgi:hypothetical protein
VQHGSEDVLEDGAFEYVMFENVRKVSVRDASIEEWPDIH